METSCTQAEFMDYIVKNDEVSVRRALDLGLDPNFTIDQTSPIISAAKRQHNNIVRLLKERGANIHDADKRGWTPIHWAAALGNAELVEMLMGWGADVTLRTPSGKTPEDLASLKRADNPQCQQIIDMIQSRLPIRTRSMTRAHAGQPADALGVAPYIPTYPNLYNINPGISSFFNDSLLAYAPATQPILGASDIRPPKPRTTGASRPKPAKVRGDGEGRRCLECHTSDTPQWRRGPQGMGTLCNACGLKFIHMHNRDKKNARRRELYMLQKKNKQASGQK